MKGSFLFRQIWQESEGGCAGDSRRGKRLGKRGRWEESVSRETLG